MGREERLARRRDNAEKYVAATTDPAAAGGFNVPSLTWDAADNATARLRRAEREYATLMAVNALVNEQRETNRLLRALLGQSVSPPPPPPPTGH